MDNHQPNHVQLGSNQAEIVVVMVPFTGQGHLNQLLRLSRLISACGIPVHFVATITHSRQAKQGGIHGCDIHSNHPNFHFHEFSIPQFTCPPPDPNATIKFPVHTLPSINASLHLREPVAKLLRSLSQTTRRVVVIHDSLITSVVQDIVSIPNAKAYMFRPYSSFYFYVKIMGEIEPEKPRPGLSLEDCFGPKVEEYIVFQESHQTFHSGIIYDSSRLVEGKYIDFLTKIESCDKIKQWGLGPFSPVEVQNVLLVSGPNSRHESLTWLDKHDENSVIYVSFGTTTCLGVEQINQLAIGLEQSEQKFIWVVRDADKGDELGDEVRRVELPKGYEERVEGKGLIMRDWVPQLQILGHPSTGGFMSHCGWNSVMESITMGVPIATWPMHSDQPRNAVLVTEELGIGLVAKDWDRRDELVTSVTIENVVRKLMASEDGGGEIRKRVAKLGGDVRRSVAQGDVTCEEFNKFIAHITR